MNLSNLVKVFPEAFDFYHLGKVQEIQGQPLPELTDGQYAIAFKVQGEIQAHVYMFLDEDLDYSVYSELGNILVSRWLNNLSSEEGIDCYVSPPQKVQRELVLKMIKHERSVFYKSYAHFCENSVISVHTLVVPVSKEEIGHA